jgi:hypothetical protein
MSADCPWTWSARKFDVTHTHANILDLIGPNVSTSSFFAMTTLIKKQKISVHIGRIVEE